jgi:hypothetical protein
MTNATLRCAARQKAFTPSRIVETDFSKVDRNGKVKISFEYENRPYEFVVPYTRPYTNKEEGKFANLINLNQQGEDNNTAFAEFIERITNNYSINPAIEIPCIVSFYQLNSLISVYSELFDLKIDEFDLKVKGSLDFIGEAEEKWRLLNEERISFYPSAGLDLVDISFAEDEEKVKKINPTLFLRSDYMIHDITECFSQRNIQMENFEVLNHIEINPSEWDENQRNRKRPSISIYKLKELKSGTSKIVIHFGGFYNEEILKILILKSAKLPIIYSVCDGIWYGMGNFYIKSVPAYLYAILGTVLDIEYIISDITNNQIANRLLDKNGGSNNKNPIIDIMNIQFINRDSIQGINVEKAIETIELYTEVSRLSGGLILKKKNI